MTPLEGSLTPDCGARSLCPHSEACRDSPSLSILCVACLHSLPCPNALDLHLPVVKASESKVRVLSSSQKSQVLLAHTAAIFISVAICSPSLNESKDFPSDPVVKNPPANAGDMGSIPGPGGSYVPWSN